MRNLVVCCDGTWNTPDQTDGGIPMPTNVVRIFNAVAEKDQDGNPQLKYYHTGVGTEGDWWERVAGGSVGGGLGKNIQSAYRWLGANYQTGDRLFLLGFSRGAYTVRSLGGMILNCGLLDLSNLKDDEELWKRVETVYSRGYRNGQNRAKWGKNWAFHKEESGKPVEIFFLGVWDTVGALGVPDDLALLNLIDDPSRYSFHDTELSDKVINARHAVALDELRASFIPTLWTGIEGRPDVRQLWFPGVHCNVGGGYAEKGLSDGALAWMMDEAGALGLEYIEGMREQLKPDARGPIYDSRTGVFKKLRTQPRSIPPIREGEKTLHLSVTDRQKNAPIAQAPYRPTIIFTGKKERQTSVYAQQHWNDTRLYLEPGEYQFTASGQWLDRNIKCGPGGTDDGKFQMGELAQVAGSLWGKVEKAFESMFKNRTADFYGTKREEDFPWFSLVGAIANGGNPGIDGTPAPHETFLIGDGRTYEVKNPGYLYCFANDSWHFYDNNRGSVSLKVKRVA